jgi:hypothetical protein
VRNGWKRRAELGSSRSVSKNQVVGRLPGSGVPMIQLNMRIGSAKTVNEGIPELKSAGLITDTTSGEPTLTAKGHRTSVWLTTTIKERTTRYCVEIALVVAAVVGSMTAKPVEVAALVAT